MLTFTRLEFRVIECESCWDFHAVDFDSIDCQNNGQPSIYYGLTGQLKRDDKAAQGMSLASGIEGLGE